MSSVNIGPLSFPKLSEEEYNRYKTNEQFKYKVVKAVNDTMKMYSYQLTDSTVQKLPTKVGGLKNILLDTNNYKKLEHLLVFLNKLGMPYISSLVFLSLCQSQQSNPLIKQKLNDSGYWTKWIKTQSYIPVCSFTGLEYNGNSCYQDSVMLALFAIPNQFIDENILHANISDITDKPNRQIICGKNKAEDLEFRTKIQTELQNITNSIRNGVRGKDCSLLRQMIKKCPSSSKQKFHEKGMQDASEFLQYLFALFEIEGMTQQITVQVSNDLAEFPSELITSEKDKDKETTAPIVPMFIQNPSSDTKINTNLFLQTIDDIKLDEDNLYRVKGKNYKRVIWSKKIISTPSFLVFYANRVYKQGMKEKRTNVEITPAEEIKIDSKLFLYAIVVHHQQHYTCYIRCGQLWFYYNDMNNQITFVGTYEQMLEVKGKPNVKSKGVLYFYSASQDKNKVRLNPALYALISTYVPEHSELLTKLSEGFIIKETRNGRTYANGVLHSFNDEPAIDNDEEKWWYKNGRRHRDNDLPAVIWADGGKEWYQNGKLHRGSSRAGDNDLPAVINADGSKTWFRNGERHRDNDLPAVVWSEGQEWWQNDKLHRDNNKPAVINVDGTQEWYKNGELHRDNDLPAIIHANGDKEWYINGSHQRDNDKPAVDSADSQEWYKNDELHRDNDLPAIIHANGDKEWYQNGKLHRDNDLPAVINADGGKEWWKNGKRHRDNDLPAVEAEDGQQWWRNGELYRDDNHVYKQNVAKR